MPGLESVSTEELEDELNRRFYAALEEQQWRSVAEDIANPPPWMVGMDVSKLTWCIGVPGGRVYTTAEVDCEYQARGWGSVYGQVVPMKPILAEG